MKAIVMEECGYLWTAKQLNILSYLLYSGFGWIQMEVFVAERVIHIIDICSVL